MKRVTSARRRKFAWVIGGALMVALGFAVKTMLQSGQHLAARLGTKVATPSAGETAPLPELGGANPTQLDPNAGAAVRGIVRMPDGEPAAGASVSVWRALTAWPEWRRERLGEEAITGADGIFQFRFADTRGLLVSFVMPSLEGQLAGGLVEVPAHGDLDLRLVSGFELFGFVTTDAGSPVANARVALESVPTEERRAAVAITNAEGRYRFANVPAGPVRLVARHEAWQPRTLSPIVVGDLRRVDLSFDRPAMAPLRGRVTSAATFGPIEGALVELLPLSSKLGLADPASARTGRDGTFLIAGLGRGNMRLVVRHPEHGFVLRTETVGISNAEVLVELPKRTEVRGQVFAESGAAPFRAGDVVRVRDAAGQLAFVELDAEGRFRCPEPVSPGFAHLRVVTGNFAFRHSLAADLEVRIDEAASTELELPVVPPSRVRGRVLDEAGRPLAGVAVVRTKPLPDAEKFSDAATQWDFGAIGSQVVQLFVSDRDELLATTAKDGSFEVVGIGPGVSLLRMTQRGFGSQFRGVVIEGAAAALDLGEVRMPKGNRVRGQVLRGARPLAGATVSVVGIGSQAQATAVTDGVGAFVLDDLLPGDYRIRARLPTQPAGSPPRSIRVVADQPTPDQRILLDTGRSVQGTVVGSDGQPVAGALVVVRGSRGTGTVTEDDGAFMLELPERAVELSVSLPDRGTSTVVKVQAREDRLTVRLDTPPCGTLLARVAGLPQRNRMTSVRLRLVPIEGDGEGQARTRWLELRDGVLSFAHCPLGRVRVEIWCDGYAPFTRVHDFTAEGAHDFGEVLLEPGARLQGRVVDAEDRPVANANVMLGEEADLEVVEAGVRTDAEGRFTIQGLCARASRLLVRSPGHAPTAVDVRLPEDVLAPTPLLVRLARGSTIEVVVARDQRGSGLVQLRRDGRFLAGAEIDEAGRVWFANRAAGKYTVHVVGSESPPVPVVVPVDVPVVVVPIP